MEKYVSNENKTDRIGIEIFVVFLGFKKWRSLYPQATIECHERLFKLPEMAYFFNKIPYFEEYVS